MLIIHYADLLKFMCTSLFGWDGKKDERGRELLQRVGTDVIRAQRPDFWVDFIIEELKLFAGQWDYVLIPDARFPNEIDRLKEAGFDVTHLRIEREVMCSTLTAEQKKHSSETALDDVQPDHVVYNNGTLIDLTRSILMFAREIDAVGNKE